MRIITRSGSSVPASDHADWQSILAASFRDAGSLLEYLQLSPELIAGDAIKAAVKQFPVLVPPGYAALMKPGDPRDPLLLQVLPRADENQQVEAYVPDPLAEKHSNARQGIIHKYQGRALMLATGGCAINCRYCFRRHFDYSANRLGRRDWQQALEYIAKDSSISELILSGGDPLMLQDDALSELISLAEAIPHLTRLRIHSRLPVVIPERITDALIRRLEMSRLNTVVVLHINHPDELTPVHKEPLKLLRNSGTWLLNQAVLLKDVNDDLMILSDLSERLFAFGITPYYLHLPDPVTGTHHFDSGDDTALRLHHQLRSTLPGYLVPQLVREIAGEPYKIPYISLTSGQ